MTFVNEYLKSNNYLNRRTKTINELNEILINLKSPDIHLRKQGAKRLSYHSRRELGWNCLPVRKWFIEEKNKKVLSEIILSETSEKILWDLLLVLHFFYERYLIHDMWKEIYDENLNQKYKKWILSLTEKFIDHKSSLIKQEVAYNLVMIGDSRGWDIFNQLLKKRASTTARFSFAFHQYIKTPLLKEQRLQLIKTFDLILSQTKNPSICKEITSLKKMCEKLKD